MSKFPLTIKTASSIKALHNAIPSARKEGENIADHDVLVKFADVFSIAWSLTESMMRWYRRSVCNDRYGRKSYCDKLRPPINSEV